MLQSKRKTVRAAQSKRRKVKPILVRAIDFVMYCTNEMEPTRKFYRDLFGLQRGDEWNKDWSEFKTSPVTLCLNGPSDKAQWQWQGAAAVAFAIDNIHEAIEMCRRKKVPILIEPMETRVCWIAFIQDPSGNRICLHQRKDGTAG